MFLPSIPYIAQKNRRQTLQFGGINYTENCSDGQFSDANGVCTQLFPTLSPRPGRSGNNHYARATSIFAHDALYVTADDSIYRNGRWIGNVGEGPKQFAIVGNKLCIFPDKRYYDLYTDEYGSLDAKVYIYAARATFTADGFTWTDGHGRVDVNPIEIPVMYDVDGVTKIMTYDEPSFLGNRWDDPNPAEYDVGGNYTNRFVIPEILPDGTYKLPLSKDGGDYNAGKNNSGIYLKKDNYYTPPLPDRLLSWRKYNAIIDTTSSYTEDTDSEELSFDTMAELMASDYYSGGTSFTFDPARGAYAVTGSGTSDRQTVYRVLQNQLICSSVIHPVDPQGPIYVMVTTRTATKVVGARYKRGGVCYGVVWGHPGDDPGQYPYPGEDGYKDGYWYEYTGDQRDGLVSNASFQVYVSTGANALSGFKVGDRVKVSGCITHPENNTPDGSYLVVTAITDHGITFDTSALTPGVEMGTFSVQRAVPDLDYVCAHENRLWGVSIVDKTIYASALGDPSSFYEYGVGEATSSYAVAVGSAGEWTGICSYSGAVCCWKEDILHKVYGSFPADYQVYSYNVSGVQDGSWASLQVINEVLYYKGDKGVYAYTGSTPQLISTAFGTRKHQYAVAGSNDLSYRITMQDADTRKWATYVYDIVRGLWMQEDSEHFLGYSNLHGVVQALAADGMIYSIDGNDNEMFNWTATLVPFDETSIVTKRYSKLIFRLDIAKHAWLRVYVREDNKPWRLAATITPSENSMTRVLPIRIGQCDRFTVRCDGYGKVLVRSMAREFAAGTEFTGGNAL